MEPGMAGLAFGVQHSEFGLLELRSSFQHPHFLAKVAAISKRMHQRTMPAKLYHAKTPDRASESVAKPANVYSQESAKNCTNCRLMRNNQNSPLFISLLDFVDHSKRSLGEFIGCFTP